MKKVIITGVAGFIGKALARYLLQKDMFVYGYDRTESNIEELLENPLFVFVLADDEGFRPLVQKVQNEDIDVFYHFAWRGGFTDALKDYALQFQNATLACQALEAANKLSVKKFVYAGTYNEFEIQNFIQDENFEPRLTCIYATAKLSADLVCRTLAYNYGMEYCSGLITMPCGEGNYSKQLVNVVVDQLNKGQSPKLVAGNNLYDIVDIRDIVRAFEAIGRLGKTQKRYYIGHRKLKTFRELMIQIRDIINKNVELKFGEYKDNQNIDYSMIDLNALYNDTGFECECDFEDSIKITSEWVKKLNYEKN